jgi:Ca2+-binding RTX toxin-like protein
VSGHDRIEAEAGQMVLDGGSGNDRMVAHGDGTGWLDGGTGNDILTGGDGDDQLSGGPGTDRMLGGGGADNLDGGTGTDVMWGAWEPRVETLDDGIDTFHDAFNPAATVYKGATVSDIRQMGSPLCVTLASMSAAIWSGFNFRDSIDYAGDNEYGVALFNPDTGEWEGHSVFFDGTWTDLDASVPRAASGAILPEFWPVLIARAALQQRGVDLENTDPAYIDANYPTDASDAITRLTSWDTADVTVAGSNPAALRAAIYAGHAAVAATYDADPEDMTPGVVPNHAYAVLDVLKTAAGWYIYLHNPWGRDYDTTYQPKPDGKDDGLIVLRWDEFVADFYGYARTV